MVTLLFLSTVLFIIYGYEQWAKDRCMWRFTQDSRLAMGWEGFGPEKGRPLNQL